MKNNNNVNTIQKALSEIKEYQSIITESQEQILKIVKNIESMKSEEEDFKEESQQEKNGKKPTINDYKSAYFHGQEILHETPDKIVLQANSGEYGKTKSTQRQWNVFSDMYKMHFDVSGKKSAKTGEMGWATEIDYKGQVIPFRGNKKVLKKA